jgi:hypothetical protein
MPASPRFPTPGVQALGFDPPAPVTGAARATDSQEIEVTEHRPVRLTFPQTQVKEPVVYHLGVDYAVVTSIRRAAIEDHFGWMVLEMVGEPDQLDAAETYLTSLGIQVSPVLGDIVEG